MRTLAKPAGIPVLPRHHDEAADCLLARLVHEEPARAAVAWPEGFEGGIAHRLDVATSGAVAVADDPGELARLRRAFADKALRKTYLFWAARDVPWHTNRCDRALAHDRRRRARMVVQRSGSTPHRGRWMAAETWFTRVGGRLWQAEMRSGVMHQIRLHAAFLGIALLGDRLYGGGAAPDGWPSGRSFCLHHRGFVGAGFQTSAVPDPDWLDAARYGLDHTTRS